MGTVPFIFQLDTTPLHYAYLPQTPSKSDLEKCKDVLLSATGKKMMLSWGSWDPDVNCI